MERGMTGVYFDMRKTGRCSSAAHLTACDAKPQHIRDSKWFSLCEKHPEAGREGVAAA
jgi:hypothetical protein